jgi:hypothetical protein
MWISGVNKDRSAVVVNGYENMQTVICNRFQSFFVNTVHLHSHRNTIIYLAKAAVFVSEDARAIIIKFSLLPSFQQTSLNSRHVTSQ